MGWDDGEGGSVKLVIIFGVGNKRIVVRTGEMVCRL